MRMLLTGDSMKIKPLLSVLSLLRFWSYGGKLFRYFSFLFFECFFESIFSSQMLQKVRSQSIKNQQKVRPETQLRFSWFFNVSWLGFWRSRPLKMMVSCKRNAHFHKSACFGKGAFFGQESNEKSFKNPSKYR